MMSSESKCNEANWLENFLIVGVVKATLDLHIVFGLRIKNVRCCLTM